MTFILLFLFGFFFVLIFRALFLVRNKLNIQYQKLEYIFKYKLNNEEIIKAINSAKYEYREDRNPINFWFKKETIIHVDKTKKQLINYIRNYNKNIKLQRILIFLFALLLLGLIIAVQFLDVFKPINLYEMFK